MKKNALYGAAVTAAVSMLAGCAIAQPRANPCNGANCQVQVTVDANCDVTADPQELHVSPGAAPAKIVFHVSGGRFAKDNGIYVKKGGDANGQVMKLAETGPTWTMDQRRTAGTRITYGIMTVADGGKVCPPLDPTVINDSP